MMNEALYMEIEQIIRCGIDPEEPGGRYFSEAEAVLEIVARAIESLPTMTLIDHKTIDWLDRRDVLNLLVDND